MKKKNASESEPPAEKVGVMQQLDFPLFIIRTNDLVFRSSSIKAFTRSKTAAPGEVVTWEIEMSTTYIILQTHQFESNDIIAILRVPHTEGNGQ